MYVVRTVLSIVMVCAFWLVVRYNLHIFQLNGYKNNEQLAWLKKNYKKQQVLLLSNVFGIICALYNPVIVLLLLGIVLLVCIRYYLWLKRKNNKKKLVYTKRIQRLIVTHMIVNAILITASVLLGFGDFDLILGICGVTISIQPILIILSNIINKPIEKQVNNYFINDAKKKLKEVEGLKIVGVTGSYGKTSVKYYLQTLLQGHYNVLITPESYNTPMGVVKTIRESLQSTHEIFLCEMGARYVGDIKEICDIVNPQYGVITSVGPQHLETFLNIDNVVETKFELADSLIGAKQLFLNGDNEYIVDKSKAYSNFMMYSAGENKAGYYAENVVCTELGTEFDVISPKGEREHFQIKLIGKHNVVNVLGAISFANMLGIPLKELKVPARRINPVQHRLQMIKRGGITIIDDAYNSNPVGSKMAVETLAMFSGLRILITPGMVELGTDEEHYNYMFGTYAATCCDYILLVGKDRGKTIQKGALESGFAADRCVIFDNLKNAMDFAYGIKTDEHKYILLENDLPDNY